MHLKLWVYSNSKWLWCKCHSVLPPTCASSVLLRSCAVPLSEAQGTSEPRGGGTAGEGARTSLLWLQIHRGLQAVLLTGVCCCMCVCVCVCAGLLQGSRSSVVKVSTVKVGGLGFDPQWLPMLSLSLFLS